MKIICYTIKYKIIINAEFGEISCEIVQYQIEIIMWNSSRPTSNWVSKSKVSGKETKLEILNVWKVHDDRWNLTCKVRESTITIPKCNVA